MQTFLKYAEKIILAFSLMLVLYLISGCAAQKHHRSVPCPCEKRK